MQNLSLSTSTTKTRARTSYKQALINHVSKMTLCDAKLAEEILDEYIAIINDFLYENDHYQQKRTILLNKWGTYSFDKKIIVQIANKNANAYFLAGVVFKPATVICQKTQDAQTQAWQNYIWKFDDQISQSINQNCRQTQLSYYSNLIALPDYAKLKWNETDLVKMIAFRTKIYKKIVRYVLRAYHQTVLDFFMSGGRKKIIIDGLGTFSMSNGLIIMRPSVKPGQKCRRAITTRRQPEKIAKRRRKKQNKSQKVI